MTRTPDQISPERSVYNRLGFYVKTISGLVLGIILLLMGTILALRWINPPATSFTIQENWDELESERYSLREHWVPADEIPVHMKWAVIASEDQLFLEHWGFDLESIQEALDEHRQGERTRGASTISQQVTKNLFLTPAETYFRKGIEAGITVLIELFWPKERIIEMYLNIAEFGPGVYGIGKASQTFFEVPASSIDPKMATQLAAVLPSPKRMRVNPPSPYTEERSYWILRQMTHLSGIAYHQPPENIEGPDEEAMETSYPDTLSSITGADFKFGKPDSMIRSIDSGHYAEYDSVRADISTDTLIIQD